MLGKHILGEILQTLGCLIPYDDGDGNIIVNDKHNGREIASSLKILVATTKGHYHRPHINELCTNVAGQYGRAQRILAFRLFFFFSFCREQ